MDSATYINKDASGSYTWADPEIERGVLADDIRQGGQGGTSAVLYAFADLGDALSRVERAAGARSLSFGGGIAHRGRPRLTGPSMGRRRGRGRAAFPHSFHQPPPPAKRLFVFLSPFCFWRIL